MGSDVLWLVEDAAQVLSAILDFLAFYPVDPCASSGFGFLVFIFFFVSYVLLLVCMDVEEFYKS